MDAAVSVYSDCGFLLLTEACNLKCSHCYVSAEPGVGQHMSLSLVDRTFTVLQSLGINDIRLTGGEPSVHPHFRQIVEMAIHRQIRVGLVTNGIRLLRKEWGEQVLKQFSRCWISIYGLDPSSHEQVGGKAVRPIKEVLEEVGRLSQKGHWIGVSAVANVGEDCHVAEFMTTAVNFGVRRLRILPVQPDGRMLRHTQPNWTLWPEEVRRIAEIMKGHPRAKDFDILTINDPFDLSNRFDDSLSSCLLKKRGMWSIVPSGDIYPCCFTVYQPSLCLGNVSDENIDIRLHTYRGQAAEGISCHGLTPSFWRGANPRHTTCPISAIDPRGG
ncbi:MAG: radical SAM protein [Gammaproteobacteria bacterium]